jgi:hypothetical protein
VSPSTTTLNKNESHVVRDYNNVDVEW